LGDILSTSTCFLVWLKTRCPSTKHDFCSVATPWIIADYIIATRDLTTPNMKDDFSDLGDNMHGSELHACFSSLRGIKLKWCFLAQWWHGIYWIKMDTKLLAA
jgi:hypothetical protein